jgi:hypothetical protein
MGLCNDRTGRRAEHIAPLAPAPRGFSRWVGSRVSGLGLAGLAELVILIGLEVLYSVYCM